MTLRPLMVLGCTSTAGKSLLATGLARWFRRNHVDVVPFKAQNMSNNARVVEGGEIGVAQWLQARAAGVEPRVEMNPVLLKPEGDTRSQVVVLGQARHDLTEVPWRDRGPYLWPVIEQSLDALRRDHELVVIEGAGSPAEVNLDDLANNRTLAHADAAAILVVDIDRGGAFAHLYGTWSLVPDATRERTLAFVLNKFRGDPSLLDPGPAIVAERTGMAHLGVVPMLTHELPDEEGASVRASPPAGAPTVAVVRFPYASNLDELHLLAHAAHVRFATDAAELASADLVILPGSKHVAADLDWMRRRGLDTMLQDGLGDGTRLLGICGGAMMLGAQISDPDGVEGAAPGLGILPIRTEMDADKLTRRTVVDFSSLPAQWCALEGLHASGYEIRNGRIHGNGSGATGDPRVWAEGRVLATTVHGVLEDAAILEALFGVRPRAVLDDTFDALADAVGAHLDTDLLWSLVRT